MDSEQQNKQNINIHNHEYQKTGQQNQQEYNYPAALQIDIEQQSINRHSAFPIKMEQSNLSPQHAKTDNVIKQNEIVFTEQSFPPNIKSMAENDGHEVFKERSIQIKCLKIQRMEFFIQQLQLQLLREKLKKDFLNEAVFFLEITVYNQKKSDEHTYRLRRIYSDFKNLDKNIQKDLHLKNAKIAIPDYPFPKDPKNLYDKLVFQQIGQYLNKLSKIPEIFSSSTVQQFFELSGNTYSGIVKVKETFIKKRSGGRFKKKCCFSFHTWQVRYLAITSEGLMYSKGNQGDNCKIREILMFDQNFNMEYGKVQTGKEQGIKITTSTRRIFFECYSQFHFYDVLAAFKEAISLSPYIEIHRFDSFAPERKEADCKWFVDGNDYFSDLYHNLVQARSSVYITDWWLSPENYLLRPVGEHKNQESRIDRVLKNLAETGVTIMIILYKEPTIALTLDSQHTKQYLKSLHPNIIIMRHPASLLPFLWSHHEKMVVIDQQIGYIGGLDLCYGRYDTKHHHLSDLPQTVDNDSLVYFPGIDYSNARTKDFDNVKNHQFSNIDRLKQIRMPWHDVHMKVIGEPVKDMVRHFVQYWNFAKLDIYSKKNQSKIQQLIPEQQQEERKGIKKVTHRIKGAFDKIKKKVKSKILRYDSQDKLNNLQLQNEAMRGKFLPKQSRFVQFLNELKKNPQNDSGSPNSFFKEQISIPLNDIQKDHFIEKDEQQDINKNMKTIDEQKKFEFCQQHLSIDYIPNSPQSRSTSKQIQKEQEIVLDNVDQFEKQMQKIKKTQTNIAFVDQFSDYDSENNRSRQRSNEQGQNKFSNFRKANKQTTLESPKLGLKESIEKMDDIEEFNVGECINPIDRYNNKSPHYSILKQDSIEKEINIIPVVKKKESKTLKKLFGGQKNKVNINMNPLKSLANGINLLEKIHFDTFNDEEINFFQVNESNKEKNPIQVSEILDTMGPLPTQSKTQSLWKSKVQDKVINKKEPIQQQISLNDQEKIEKSKINFNFINYSTQGTCKCQMLRSGSSWSLGLKPSNTEMSIQIAYIQLISQAKHFIYIENQFFISNTAGSVVKNQVAQALIERIIQADKKGEEFFVCVVMPLLPGFSGEVNDSNAAVMKCQLHWEYFTISRGGSSIYEILKQNVSDPFKYIRFFGLRNHGKLNNQAYSEIIYVHSKLMIVDDRFVIIGSANINDRSMCGTRDSEIGMIVEDTKKVSSKMNTKNVMVSEFGHTFRKNLYEEHFGLTEQESIDPLDPQIMKLIDERTRRNTDIYREVFRCYPDDQVVQISQLENWQKERKLENYDELKDQIIGHAVELPLDFLKNEKLNFTIRQKEYYVPVQSFLQTTWKVIKNSLTFFLW